MNFSGTAEDGLREPARVDVFAGRYVLSECLKSGHGVDTHLAVDITTQTQVVLKAIVPHLIHDAARLRFEHETKVLRLLSGTGLIGLYDAGVTDEHWYLAQPFVAGSTLEEILKDGALSLLGALRVGLDVATALEAAHAAGIFHRDVKPANVIVEGVGAEATANLIDFGFARSPSLDESVSEQLVGTVRYLAPEAAGMLAVAPDERADLYALGVLLFECLAGRPPFPGRTVGEVLRQHLSMPVPEIGRIRPGMPRAIDAILQRLLSKDPADRYQSASALVYDLNALFVALTAGESDPRLVIGRIDHRRTLTDPAFVGREAELASLMTVVEDVQGGGSGLVLLEADSGGGKTRLLSEIASRASSAGLLLLRGQGVADTGARPFEVLYGFAEDLVAHSANETLWQSINEGIGEGARALAQVLPPLGPLLGVTAEPDVGPERLGEQRSLTVLHQLLSSIGDADHPVLIIFDDCQWADRLTIQLLADVFADPAVAPAYVGVIASFRSEEVDETDPLRAIPAGTSLQLGPLSARAMRQLSESMAGPLPDQAVSTVVRLADGNPFMGAAVLRGLFESGALVATDRGWQVDEDALLDVQTARRSASFLIRRLELLTPDSMQVLSAGAALGKEFDFMLAARLAGHDDAAAAILEDATRRRLIWVDEVTGRCSFAHDKIREALLGRLDRAGRAELHSRAADALQGMADKGASEFDLAYHLDAAGRHEAALPYALRSAATARNRHALDSSLAHYRMAERGVSPDDVATRAVIAEGLGDVLTLKGAYVEAEEQLEVARLLVTDRVHQAEVEGKLGALAFKQGDISTARRHLEGAMARLGRPVPRRSAWLGLCLTWELAVQIIHTALPTFTTGRRSPEGHDEDFLAMRLHSRLAYLYWFHSGKVTCAWSHLRGLNLAERYPPSAELGQAYSEHAPVATMVPLFGRAYRYAQRSLEIRRSQGDIWGQGQSQSFAAVTLYAASRFEEAEVAGREAIRLLLSTGDQWEVNTAGWNLAMCLHRTGRLQEAVKTARGVYESAVRIGDQTSAGVGLSVWTRAACGDVDPWLISAELARESLDASTTTELRLAAGIAAFRLGDLAEAAASLARAAETIRSAGLRQEYVAPVASWRATVARTLAEQSLPHDPIGRAKALHEASSAVRGARLWAWSYRNNAPHALREAGLVASLKNRPRRSSRLMARSLDTARRQGAVYEMALTRLAGAEIAAARGEDSSDLAGARLAVRGLEGNVPMLEAPSAPSVSLFDRFNTLLSVGRTITAAASVDAVNVAVRDAAFTLLRGDTCHIVSADAAQASNTTTESGETVDSVSRTLIERAITSKVPVVAGNSSATVSESLVVSDIRSVLAAPIIVHGETRYCFYVTHRQISQLFGDEEIRLAAFVGTLAGAAFEHLEGTETRYRSLTRNSSDVLTLVGSDGIVTYQSSAASRVFALDSNGMTGRPIVEWVHPEDRGLFSEALRRARLDNDARVECRFLHTDGSYLYAETAVTDLLDDPAVGAFVLNSRDVTDRRRLEDELRERALHDSLTGLPNRAQFLERAQLAVNRRDPHPLVACFLDLDDFKSVNDTYGHGAGDELLCEMGRRLVTCLRPEDVVARFGGDEFAILLEHTTLAEALRVIRRVQEATSRPVEVAGTSLVTNFSIGLAPSTGQHTTTDQLMAEADVAMYAAKASGTHFRVYEPQMRDLADTRSLERGALERALGQGEFKLHYQPIVDLVAGECVGVEALLRWEHPERGLLPAAEFIDLAEVSGHLPAIGAWVIDAACAEAANLNDGLCMSVNVSPHQLEDPGLVDGVRRALAGSGLDPDRLVLEITETSDIANFDTAVEHLQALADLGVKIALDDFGTGYSTLNHLKRLPVHILKIDRAFVHNIVHSAEDRSIVRGVVDLARSFGLSTVVEGVEDAEQRRIVAELGCTFGQGYLWARPCLPADLPDLFIPAPPTAA